MVVYVPGRERLQESTGGLVLTGPVIAPPEVSGPPVAGIWSVGPAAGWWGDPTSAEHAAIAAKERRELNERRQREEVRCMGRSSLDPLGSGSPRPRVAFCCT